MNRARIHVDELCMVHLISKLAGMLTDNETHEHVIAQLRLIARLGREVELEPIQPSSTATVMHARILHVDEKELFIDSPQIDGANRPLVRNEKLRLAFRIDGKLLCGDVESCGRCKREVNGETQYGYRLTIPSELAPPRPSTLRGAAVEPKPRHYVIEAELRCLKRDIPVRGVIAALSEKMVHVRSMNAPQWLREGDRLSFKAQLPRPVGSAEQTVTVNSVKRIDDRGMTMIGMTFVVPMHGLSALFEHGPVRWG